MVACFVPFVSFVDASFEKIKIPSITNMFHEITLSTACVPTKNAQQYRLSRKQTSVYAWFRRLTGEGPALWADQDFRCCALPHCFLSNAGVTLIPLRCSAFMYHVPRFQVKMLMDLVCSSCGELMEDAVKKNMRIRVLASDATRVSKHLRFEFGLVRSGSLVCFFAFVCRGSACPVACV